MPETNAGGSPKMLSVLEVVRSSTDYLQKHGVDSPRLNAELLVAHALGKKQRIDLYLEFDRPIGSVHLNPLRELLRRRGKGEPLQHLVGTVEFCGREFAVDARALIPRPETEHFVELLLKLTLPPNAVCVDVGVGSGVIALTLAAELPEATVSAVDISRDALALAKENAAKLGLGDRLSFICSDLLEQMEGPFDLIAANLPYVATSEVAGLSREVRCDPMLALDGGADGLEIVGRLIAQARSKIATGGVIGLEIGCDQGLKVKELLTQAGFVDASVRLDYQEKPRFAFAYQRRA